MKETVFQEIFEKISEMISDDWKKLVVCISYTEGSCSINYYTDNGNGIYVDCFSQKNTEKAHLIRLFMDINRILEPERSVLDDKNRWSVMTMAIDSDGNMEAEFDYTNISGRTIEYEEEWKRRYLK